MKLGFNPKNCKIKTDAGISIDRAFLAHLSITAAEAVAASTTGIHAAMNLTDVAQAIITGITNPSVARNVQIVGNVAGIDGTVKITGTRAGKVISEEIVANGTTAVEGALAFDTITKIELPIRDHAPVAQVETVTVTAGSDKAATLVVTVTAAGMTNNPKAVNVDVTIDDNTAAEVATKVRAALTADADVGAFFTVSGADADIVLTAKAPVANDATMAIALTDAATSTVTFGASGNTTAGVPYDRISVGWGDKLGLPYMLSHNTVIPGMTFLNNTREATEPTVTVDADELEKNTVDLNSALAGTAVDIYFAV